MTQAAIVERFFNVLDEPVPVPGPIHTAGDAVPRDSPEWANYEAQRRPDQLDLWLPGRSGGGGTGAVGSGSGGRKKGEGVVGMVGGFGEQQQQHRHHHHEERKTSYALPTEEEIRAVLVQAKSSANANANANTGIGIGAGVGVGGGVGMGVGMTRTQLEMALKGNRPAPKLGLKEHLDEVIERKELGLEGSDRLVWREEEVTDQ